jgi:osmotically-inducible protein OsmY
MKTDSQLQGDVLDELKWWPNVDAAHIGVVAKDGVVTLSGQVSQYTERQAAEDAAKVVYGVKALANDISVELPGASKRSDQDIAGTALAAMKWDLEVPNDKIKLTVKSGWITLEGTVDWQFQKDAAARSVRYLMGVVGVSNSIKIKPNVSWTDVKSKIEDALRRNADVEARRITVSTDNGTVTLTGSVDSWSERDAAVSSAWSAPGVTSVTDYLLVTP